VTEGREPRDEPLSHGDTTRWHMATPENPMVIGALLFLDGRLTLDELDELVRTKLLAYRRFQQHVVEPSHVLVAPRWRDDAPFDLRAHVARISSDAPVDEATLASLVSDRLTERLGSYRSPWKLELIDLASGSSALLVRVHHCIADGQALVHLLEDLAAVAPAARAPARTSRPVSSASAARDLVRWSLHGARALHRWITLPKEPPTHLRGRPFGQKRVAWSDAVSLDAIKAIAHARGHRVTDVLLAAVAGAIGRYLDAHGSGPPASLRGLLPLAAPGTSTGLGNHYASVFVDLPLEGTNRSRRLDEVARRTAALRDRGEAQIALEMAGLAGVLAARVEHLLVRWLSQKASFVVSSVPGPEASLRLAGRPVRSIVVWAPAPGSIAASFTLFGYAGDLRLGVETDAAVVAHPEDLVQAFGREIDELARSAGGVAGHA